jgi:multidrug resistance efflux pump/predicted flap endonuclease-1-like 5' DNA nuclease
MAAGKFDSRECRGRKPKDEERADFRVFACMARERSSASGPENAMDSQIVATLPAGYHVDRQYGVVYDRIPPRTDDLTRISGLHQREASLLNDHGIFCYGQIALWRHRELSRFADDLQIPLARVIDEGWVSQAREFCRERLSPGTGSSIGLFRTITALVCALLLGVLLVWVLASRQNSAIPGVMIAEVTRVKLPAAAVVQSVHVRPGEEVFTGQKLITLENTAHTAEMTEHQKLVREAERTVRRLEAQAVLEIESRRHELAYEIDEVRRRLQRQGGGRPLAESGPSTILFFSAKSASAIAKPALAALPAADNAARIRPAASSGVSRDPSRQADGNASTLQAELERLESLQAKLQENVEAAVGLIAARENLTEASEELQRLQTLEKETLLSSPNYGVVGAVDVHAGDEASAGRTVVRILHPDKRSVLVRLPASRLAELSVGEKVEVRFPGASGYEGRVSAISPMTETGEPSGDAGQRIAIRIEPSGRIWPTVPVGCEVQVYSWK